MDNNKFTFLDIVQIVPCKIYISILNHNTVAFNSEWNCPLFEFIRIYNHYNFRLKDSNSEINMNERGHYNVEGQYNILSYRLLLNSTVKTFTMH